MLQIRESYVRHTSDATATTGRGVHETYGKQCVEADITPKRGTPMSVSTEHVVDSQIVLIRVMKAMAGEIRPMSGRAVAKLAGVTYPKARGALASALSEGWVECEDGSWWLSPRLSELGFHQLLACAKAVRKPLKSAETLLRLVDGLASDLQLTGGRQ